MENTFFALDENNNKVEYEVLFAYDSEKTGVSYVVYTDNTTDEDGDTRAYASAYTEKNGEMELLPIETEEEYQEIEALLNEIFPEQIG